MDQLLSRLRDHLLYLHNGSFGNPAWEAAPFRVLVLRLSPFEDVQRSTPHLFLAAEARRGLPDAFVDLAFLPRPSDAGAMTSAGISLILGTQSRRALSGFDLVLVSNSWLLEQVNLPFLLSRSGVPVWASERGDEWPPIVLGGSNATAAHALVRPDGDCVADAIFFGEGEGHVAYVVKRFAELSRLRKRERLRRLAAEVPGLWPAGSFPNELLKARADAGAYVESGPAPLLPGPEASTARLSITQGCPCRCSFCFEGHDRAPFRQVAAEELLRRARELKRRTGASTLEIESFNFNTHPGLPALLPELNRLFLRVNLMSQRVDVLARTHGLLDLEMAADKKSFTLGVEGISARLRAFLRKGLTEDDLRRTVQAIHERRTRELKLFYLITGREQEPDLEELAGFVKWLKEVRLRAESAPRIVLSFAFLVRMPFTPLRHDPVSLEEKPWRVTAGRLKSICETNGLEFRLSSSWPEWRASQCLARGGYHAHELLERLAAVGCVTDAGLSDDAARVVDEWLSARHAEVEPGAAAGFPFGFLGDENSAGSLYRRYEQARAGVDAPSLAARTAVSRDAVDSLREMMDRKHRLRPVHVAVDVPPEAAGMGPEWIDAWLLRDFLARHPGQEDNVLAVSEARVSRTGALGDGTAWYGRTAAAVIPWEPEKLPPGLVRAPEAVDGLELVVHLPPQGNPAQRLAEFLRDAHAPVTVVRDGEGFRFDVPPKSLKRKLIRAGRAHPTPEGWAVELSVGTRPFVADWLDSMGMRRTARVELRSPRA